MTKRSLAVVTALLFTLQEPAVAAPPPIEAFAARNPVEGVTITPDGRRLAFIRTLNGKGLVTVRGRNDSTDPEHTVLGEPEHFRIRWCRWATDSRLLCGYHASLVKDGVASTISRLVAVDADGRHVDTLIQNSISAQGQFQDQVLDWNPGKPDTVLVQADEGLSLREAQMGGGNGQLIGDTGTHGLPAVFELNVVTGRLHLIQHAKQPIRYWASDRNGQVRLGWGQDRGTIFYYARLDGATDWKRLANFEAFSAERHFEPVAISRDEPNKAYALAEADGRLALWLIDLTDKDDPQLVYAHPDVDVGEPLFGGDGRLLGIHYETEYPKIEFTDARARGVGKAIAGAMPGVFAHVTEATRDESIYIIRSQSDVQPNSYSILDTQQHSLNVLSPPNPALDPKNLSRMQPIRYPARDGTSIPGYLTTPGNIAAKNLPLIVMPHGGPIARDSWQYDFLLQFLVSRGYAVLQMNFRGSDGYGSAWFRAAHQDWGGLTYDDVVDGTRWAIATGIADPRRVCIVGWSFGGYVALLGAQRNGDLFRGAVDIAGVSDLAALVSEGYDYVGLAQLRKLQLGTDFDKLRRNSPREHAADFAIPILMIHGDHDAQVPIRQSKMMAAALDRAKKPYRLIEVKDANHSLSGMTDRVTLLGEIERFLKEQLQGDAVPPP